LHPVQGQKAPQPGKQNIAYTRRQAKGYEKAIRHSYEIYGIAL
jgi:hypothetical protein